MSLLPKELLPVFSTVWESPLILLLGAIAALGNRTVSNNINSRNVRFNLRTSI